jgi:uncharacterized protein with GYD domain
MPIYVSLIKWTEEGVKNIKDSPARLKAAEKLTEAVGGKITHSYITMGEYDMVVITEATSEEAGTAALLSIASRGFVRTVTMRAFTPAEFAKILKQMP